MNTQDQRAALDAQLKEAMRAVDARLAARPDELRRLHIVAAEFFLAQSEGKTYRRRPNMSLTLIPDGSPPAKVAVYPGWDRRARRLMPDRVRVEVVVERVSVCGLPQPTTEIALQLMENSARWTRLSRWSPEALQRLLPTIAAFLADPPAVFARSADHCCICGKGLSDEVSRVRGIGPECFKGATRLRRIIEQKLANERSLVEGPER
jgi:hypothetical protein